MRGASGLSEPPAIVRSVADDTTPGDLERELGIDQRRIRHYLRQVYGHLPAYTDNWHLNGRAADDVRRHFQAEARAAGRTAPVLREATVPLPVLFRDATGSTTYDADGNLVYLPGADEERARV